MFFSNQEGIQYTTDDVTDSDLSVEHDNSWDETGYRMIMPGVQFLYLGLSEHTWRILSLYIIRIFLSADPYKS